jgi:hypothetical protein
LKKERKALNKDTPQGIDIIPVREVERIYAE